MSAGVFILMVLASAGAPANDCPAPPAVEAEIGRMGAATALARTGTSEITVEEALMRIVLRGHDGKVLGMREVAAPAACQERAVVAAVVIVAWLGQWSGGEPRPPAPPVAPPLVAAPAPVAAPVVVPSARGRRPAARGDIAALAFGVHDGDQGTWGFGAQASYDLGDWFAVTALGEGTGERARPLGPGQATYRSIRFGLGLALRRTSGRIFWDGSLSPEAVRLSLRGQGLAIARAATAWDLALDGRVRVGLRLARVVPFVYGDVSYALAAAHLTLDNRPDSVTLSRRSFAVGAGVLFSFGPLTR